MGRDRKKLKSRRHKSDIRKSSTFQETKPKNKMQITISKDMPQFLVEANTAITAGQIERARELVNDEAVRRVRRIVEKKPFRTDIMFILAVMLHKTGQLDKAEEWLKQIIEVQPSALVYNELAVICDAKGCLSEDIEYLRKAMELDPDNPGVCHNLGMRLIGTGQIKESIDLLRKAVEKEPDNIVFRTNLLHCLHYLPDMDSHELFEEHKRWGLLHAPLGKAKTVHNNNRNPDRRLRIGYISPNFRKHSVVYFFELLLDRHNRENVEVYGYGNVEHQDQITERLKEKFDCYRDIYGMDDKAVANIVEQDAIDILIDLAGHTVQNRLLVMALKPAPVQVTYLGYAGTTGMQQVDYRLTDALAEPPELQEFYSEKLAYLPKGHHCYGPEDFGLGVEPLPALRNGYVTFGSFNNSCKTNLFIMKLWANILKVNDKSHLLLKFKCGIDQGVREHYFRQFGQLGISPDRLEIYDWNVPVEHLQLYNRMDIALDTYPYNGATTTCEALWMGVPVISLTGKTYVSRLGLSILTNVGLGFFAASTPEEYVAKATALAAKPEALAKIRATMRQRMLVSSLCDAKTFADSVEEAYRKMWHRWCL